MYKEWNITIPALTGKEKRKAYVYVPDAYRADDSRRYPVLYMFDGHNLFADADASYGKCWGMLDYLTANNVPLILAAIECNHHSESDPCGGRLSEGHIAPGPAIPNRAQTLQHLVHGAGTESCEV